AGGEHREPPVRAGPGPERPGRAARPRRHRGSGAQAPGQWSVSAVLAVRGREGRPAHRRAPRGAAAPHRQADPVLMGARPRTLAVIPARGGSKGVPRKNVRPVLGRPLLAYTVDTALASRHLLHDVVLSTDEEEIAEVGRS